MVSEDNEDSKGWSPRDDCFPETTSGGCHCTEPVPFITLFTNKDGSHPSKTAHAGSWARRGVMISLRLRPQSTITRGVSEKRKQRRWQAIHRAEDRGGMDAQASRTKKRSNWKKSMTLSPTTGIMVALKVDNNTFRIAIGRSAVAGSKLHRPPGPCLFTHGTSRTCTPQTDRLNGRFKRLVGLFRFCPPDQRGFIGRGCGRCLNPRLEIGRPGMVFA